MLRVHPPPETNKAVGVASARIVVRPVYERHCARLVLQLTSHVDSITAMYGNRLRYRHVVDDAHGAGRCVGRKALVLASSAPPKEKARLGTHLRAKGYFDRPYRAVGMLYIHTPKSRRAGMALVPACTGCARMHTMCTNAGRRAGRRYPRDGGALVWRQRLRGTIGP